MLLFWVLFILAIVFWKIIPLLKVCITKLDHTKCRIQKAFKSRNCRNKRAFLLNNNKRDFTIHPFFSY